MSEIKVYKGKIIEEPTYQVLDETNESYFNLKLQEDEGTIIDIAIGGNVTNDFYQYRIGRRVEIQTEKIAENLNKAIKVNFTSKYMVYVGFTYSNHETIKDFDTKLEIKEFINKIADKNKKNEVAFFLYSMEENKKILIGYLECNYGKWENYEFYKRGSEKNTGIDYFAWDKEPIKLDKEKAEEEFYKNVCNKYIETRGEHFIVEDSEGIHYLELDDSYDDVNINNYKSLLKNGEDTIYNSYKELYYGVVEYNVYEDLQDKNFGYTLGNFYLSNNELIKLGIDQELDLHLREEEEEDCL